MSDSEKKASGESGSLESIAAGEDPRGPVSLGGYGAAAFMLVKLSWIEVVVDVSPFLLAIPVTILLWVLDGYRIRYRAETELQSRAIRELLAQVPARALVPERTLLSRRLRGDRLQALPETAAVRLLEPQFFTDGDHAGDLTLRELWVEQHKPRTSTSVLVFCLLDGPRELYTERPELIGTRHPDVPLEGVAGWWFRRDEEGIPFGPPEIRAAFEVPVEEVAEGGEREMMGFRFRIRLGDVGRIALEFQVIASAMDGGRFHEKIDPERRNAAS